MKLLVDMNPVARLGRPAGASRVRGRPLVHHRCCDIRSQDLLSDVVVSIVAKALDAHREDIERGALVSIVPLPVLYRLFASKRTNVEV